MRCIHRVAVVAALAALAACMPLSGPAPNPSLEQARAELAAVVQDPAVKQYASAELIDAQDALVRAEQSWLDGSDAATVAHRAYVARQRTAIAREAAGLRQSNARINAAESERARLRTAVRAQAEAAARAQAEAAARAHAETARAQAEVARAVPPVPPEAKTEPELDLAGLATRATSRGTVVTLDDALFAPGGTALSQRAEPMLDRLAGALRRVRNPAVLVEGHSDSSGDPGRDVELSGRRAAAIRAGLIARGVPAAQIRAVARADASPVASNDTDAGRARNRRVEVVVVSAGPQAAGAAE